MLSSCSTREICHVPFMALRPLECSSSQKYSVDMTRTVTGSDKRFHFHILSARSTIYQAAMNAIADENRDCIGIANVRIEWTGCPYEHIMNLNIPHQYTVTGNPVFQH